MGHGRVGRTFDTIVGGGVKLGLWGPRSKLCSNTKQFDHNWYSPCCQCTETYSHVSSKQKSNPFVSAKYKQPSGQSFLPRIGSLLRQVPYTIRLMPTEDTWHNCGWRSCFDTLGLTFESGFHRWYLSCCQCTIHAFMFPPYKSNICTWSRSDFRARQFHVLVLSCMKSISN